MHNAAEERGIPVWCGGMLETGIGRAHNIALSSLANFSCREMYRLRGATGPKTSSSRRSKFRAEGEITVPTTARRGFEVRSRWWSG